MKEYNAVQQELEITRAIIDARNSLNLTQKQLSSLTGIDQADISKMENGIRNPSISLLRKLANGMGMKLKIEFVPKEKKLTQFFHLRIVKFEYIVFTGGIYE